MMIESPYSIQIFEIDPEDAPPQVRAEMVELPFKLRAASFLAHGDNADRQDWLQSLDLTEYEVLLRPKDDR